MLDTRRPFTRSDALAAGFTPAQLRGSRFRRLFHNVYVDATVPDHPLIRAQGALLLQSPSAIASHTTAALVLDLPVRRDALEHVTVPRPSERTQNQGIRCHVGATDSSWEAAGGVRVPTAPMLFAQLACMLSLVDLVVVGDAMVRRRMTTPEALVAFTGELQGKHCRLARQAASFVRSRVDSPMESRLRMLLVLAGLPEPAVNVEVCDELGRPLRRIDLSYPAVRLAVEYDGRHHIERERQWQHDLDRREEFEEDGWRFLVVTSEGIYRDPARTVVRVWTALRGRGADVPVRPGDRWRPHFPI
ncbi:MAG TPA: hypothetical protein VFK41_02165 [Nocardioidaceae bacterium]|nr:hypothetical protein [Nocardioidaceae bacterium]